MSLKYHYNASLKYEVTKWSSLNNLARSLITKCDNNGIYFSSYRDAEFVEIFENIADIVKSSIDTVRAIEQFAGLYDFDEQTPGNGYRSFVFIYETALIHALRVCDEIAVKRDGWFFRRSHYVKEARVCVELIRSIFKICEKLIKIHKSSQNGNLYASTSGSSRNIITNSFKDVDQECFHGRALGFQYADSLRGFMAFLDVAMTSQSDMHYTKGSICLKFTNLLLSIGKYSLNVDARAAKYMDVTENASMEFCKSYWQGSELGVMKALPSIFGSRVEVSHLFEIDAKPMRMYSEKFNRKIDVPLPQSYTGLRPIPVRLISARRRGRMIGQLNSTTDLSDFIILHCHGGGWTCQSSRSHEFYLRDWAVRLDIPILSIDYSLAPENPFPRAFEEVFYTYCWLLQNADLVGSTGKKIIFVGDSAGGNLNTACVVKIIETGIAKPFGLFNIFTPFFLDFCTSPARFLSFVDPLLPYGFAMRVFKNYGSKTAVEKSIEQSAEIYGDRKQNSMEIDGIFNAFNIFDTTIPKAAPDEFDFSVSQSPYLSPYLADAEILSEFPPTKILTIITDPCLDDCVEFSKKLRSLKVKVSLDILNGVNHGFLNFTGVSSDCHLAALVCLDKIVEMMSCDEDASL